MFSSLLQQLWYDIFTLLCSPVIPTVTKNIKVKCSLQQLYVKRLNLLDMQNFIVYF